MARGLRKARQMLPAEIKGVATDLQTVLEGVNKTRIDPDIKAAQELANRIYFQGEFGSIGIVDQQFQDHGVGQNLLKFKDSLFLDRPRSGAAWVFYDGVANAAVASLTLSFSGRLGTDAIAQSSTVGAYGNWQAFTVGGSQHVTGTSNLYSAMVVASEGTDIKARVRAVQFATESDMRNNVSPVVVETGDEVSVASGAVGRPSVAFIPTTNWVRYEHRIFRVSGTAGFLPGGKWAYPMLEEILLGQRKPSKYVMPIPDRGDFASNLLEGNALLGYISGLTVSRGATLTVNVSEGQCYVPGLSRVVSYAGGTVDVGSGAGVKYIYLKENADGTASAVASTDVPDAPYTGTARTRPALPTQRFIGVVVTYGGAIASFRLEGDHYTFQDAFTQRLVDSGSPTTNKVVDLDAYVPAFCRTADIALRAQYATAGFTAYIATVGVESPQAGVGVMGAAVGASNQGNEKRGPVGVNIDLQVHYALTNAGGTAFVYVMGFWLQR